jgi:CRP-like cAMP-binding protein
MEISMNHAKDKFLRFLSTSAVLSEQKKKRLYELPIFKRYAKDTVLFERGSRTEQYYFVINGGIRTYKIVDGKDITLEFYIENEAFAPVSTVLSQPSNSYAVCFEDTVMVVSTEEIEEEVTQVIPEFLSLCRKFSEKLLAKQQESVERYKTLSPEQAYLHLVSERPQLIQRVPQYHIATYLGIRPESLSRIRNRISHTRLS